MLWPQIGALQYHAQLGLPDKGGAINELVFCNDWDQEHFDLLIGLSLGCYQPSPEIISSLKVLLNSILTLIHVYDQSVTIKSNLPRVNKGKKCVSMVTNTKGKRKEMTQENAGC